MMIITIEEWLESSEFVISELPNRSFQDQIKKLEEVGNGVGLLLHMKEIETYEGEKKDQLETIPIMKFSNRWCTVKDENIGDMFISLLRIVGNND